MKKAKVPLRSSAWISTQMMEDEGRIRALFVSNCDLREGKSARKLLVEMKHCDAGPMSITTAVRGRRFHESCSYLGQTACVPRGIPLTIPLGASLWRCTRDSLLSPLPCGLWPKIPVVCDCLGQSDMALKETRTETSKREMYFTKTTKRRWSLK